MWIWPEFAFKASFVPEPVKSAQICPDPRRNNDDIQIHKNDGEWRIQPPTLLSVSQYLAQSHILSNAAPQNILCFKCLKLGVYGTLCYRCVANPGEFPPRAIVGMQQFDCTSRKIKNEDLCIWQIECSPHRHRHAATVHAKSICRRRDPTHCSADQHWLLCTASDTGPEGVNEQPFCLPSTPCSTASLPSSPSSNYGRSP
jgi:hypothetical protein